MPRWGEFAWAAFLYGAICGDHDYRALINKTQFLNGLRSNPEASPINEIRQLLIKGFLNRWKCRITNTPQSARIVRAKLIIVQPYLRVLDNLAIEDVNFNQIINVNNEQMTVDEAIKECYTHVTNIRNRFAATAASKLLHILQPKLFVMWDKDILTHYKDNNYQVSNGAQGYCVYLHLMQDVATQVLQSFQNATLNPPAGINQCPADYLSMRMKYNPPKTMAKYIDEYNWVVITNRVHVPPLWHP
jgi:hypothetical protein